MEIFPFFSLSSQSLFFHPLFFHNSHSIFVSCHPFFPLPTCFNVHLFQVTRKLCEEELVQIKGVISFTFVMNKSRCLVRCKIELSPETLCDAINKTKVLSAQQVVKNERGEEVRCHHTLIIQGGVNDFIVTSAAKVKSWAFICYLYCLIISALLHILGNTVFWCRSSQ